MSTEEERALGDDITPSDPDNGATPTPIATVETTAHPTEVRTWVNTKGDLVSIHYSSSEITALLMLEAGPARELIDDLEAAIAEVEGADR